MKRIEDISKTKHGHLGAAVVVPENLTQQATETFSKHEFNLVASDLIGERRDVGDYRSHACFSEVYPTTGELAYLATSVIIVFHNEAWSTLIRTINSVIDKTPISLLHEIILVDDFSSMEHLKHDLDLFAEKLKVKIRVLRNPSRLGLIVARLKGAEVATGKTITFLDAHCEVTTGWMEPLLTEIHHNKKTIACPIIDIISESNFQYIASEERTWGGFDWQLTFRWEHSLRSQDKRLGVGHASPIKTPAMAGGLFTVDKEYFYQIGSYDKGMQVWGGENVEISIRAWSCGGQILIVPCSRVGHVFRSKSPYSWPGGVSHVINRNTLRTVFVWLDEYKDLYLKSHRS
ncbi:Polypeptide N-acetylgalactosaminyltransferase 1, partial [Cichlidogyrus casuarinus]